MKTTTSDSLEAKAAHIFSSSFGRLFPTFDGRFRPSMDEHYAAMAEAL